MHSNQRIIDDLYTILEQLACRTQLVAVPGVTPEEHGRNYIRAQRLLNTAYAAVEEAIENIPTPEDLDQ